MDDIKVITICGSMRFKKEMMEIAEDLELKKVMRLFNVFLELVLSMIKKPKIN